MQCFVCGEQMRVVRAEPHVVNLPGFELRTFQCIGCGDLEKRPVFDSALALHTKAPVPQEIAPPHEEIVPPPEAIVRGPETVAPRPRPALPPRPAPAQSAQSSKMRSLIGGLVRLRSTPHP